jgi:hypothetical protein
MLLVSERRLRIASLYNEALSKYETQLPNATARETRSNGMNMVSGYSP